MKKIIKMLGLSLLSCAIFLLILFELHWNFFVAALLCIGFYIGLELLLSPGQGSRSKADSLRDSNDPAILWKEARADLKQMEHDTEQILKPEVRADARAMIGTGTKILSYLKEHPEKTNAARQFLNYYLDTASGILSRYVEFQDTGLHTEEVAHVLQKTEDVLPVIQEAFEKQFTHLMSGDLLNVEADIEVLDNMMKMGNIL